jgi:hypothetical protein
MSASRWGRPDPLADPVGETDRENVSPGAREGDERPGDGGDRVTDDGESFSLADAVGPPSRSGLGERGRGLRDAFDQPESRGARSEGPRQEIRKERIDHVGSDVGQE